LQVLGDAGEFNMTGSQMALSASSLSLSELEPLTAGRAVAELYVRHGREVRQYALMLTRDPEAADDIAAETFERALRAWREDRVPASDFAWLLRIARNLATDRWRRAARVVRATFGEPSTGLDSSTLEWLDALRVLPERQREVIVLRYFRDLSTRDAALVMGLSESGLRSLLSRAIAMLREHPEVWHD
jgi:RNA polymerase sigma-70 factor (ECF subfamily)